ILHKFLTYKPKNVTKFANGTLGNNTELRGLTIPDILRSIHRYNSAQAINNEDIFGPVQNDTLIIVIQVSSASFEIKKLLYICQFRFLTRFLNHRTLFFQIHTRIVYLRHLIVSLAQAKDIETTLLVFSHDFYDTEANDLVQAVDFARTLQIFYPYSIQTHPDTFPGQAKGDCPRDINYQQ
ncbi:unnamed protein product, partial [Nesidiocoris tenuis]